MTPWTLALFLLPLVQVGLNLLSDALVRRWFSCSQGYSRRWKERHA